MLRPPKQPTTTDSGQAFTPPHHFICTHCNQPTRHYRYNRLEAVSNSLVYRCIECLAVYYPAREPVRRIGARPLPPKV